MYGTSQWIESRGTYYQSCGEMQGVRYTGTTPLIIQVRKLEKLIVVYA